MESTKICARAVPGNRSTEKSKVKTHITKLKKAHNISFPEWWDYRINGTQRLFKREGKKRLFAWMVGSSDAIFEVRCLLAKNAALIFLLEQMLEMKKFLPG